MTASITDVDADAVFTAALTQRGRHTNLGYRIQVSVGMFNYSVTINEDVRCTIDGREGYGGTEHLHINATPEQDRALREAHAQR